jgi:hypothetical protein
LVSLTGWKGDPIERHLQFGEFWTGIIDTSSSSSTTSGTSASIRGGQHPLATTQEGIINSGSDVSGGATLIMGKLQGPRAAPGTNAPSAGFMSITKNSYYKWILYAEEGDELAFGFAPGKVRDSLLTRAAQTP